MNILFVCTGNTCRSIMAEGLLRAMINEKGLENIYIKSAGIAASSGSPASSHAIKVMKDTGIRIEDHRSQQVNEDLTEEADLILTMTEGQKLSVQSWNPSVWQKIHTLKEFAGYNDKDIQDPFGQSEKKYIQTRNEIKAALMRIIDKL